MGIFSKEAPISTNAEGIEELLTRGVTESIVEEELRQKLLSGKRLRVKLGIDPTSPDVHIGRAVPLLKLRDFQNLGHHVVLIVGDFTAVIGDTSDKDAERPMLDRATIEKNKKTYFEQVGKIIDLSKAELRYNSEWLSKLTYREIGEHADMFSVADFIARENITKRLSGGKRVSLREVLYPLMQGYDSVAVEADVELGGTDQKFNLLAGRTMQEKLGMVPQNILMNPLVNGTDGTKMSSSRGNYIALTASPQDMYGKVMSMHDNELITYFEICTRVPLHEVESIKAGLASNTLHPKEIKMRLAREIVTQYHSQTDAAVAEREWTTTFSEGGVPDVVPEVVVERGAPLYTVLESLGESKTELRRLVAAGAISTVGGNKFSTIDDTVDDEGIVRIGKHRFLKIVFK